MPMKKVLLFAGALVLFLPGCGTDEREKLIADALEEINKASGNMATIKENIVKWEKANVSEKPKLLKSAMDATQALKKNALIFQLIKGQADKLEPGTPESRKELVEKYRDRFASAIESANKERIALNEAIARAEKKEKAPLADLKISLQQAQGDFENIVKQR
jgi:hypothetical protein